MLKDRTRKYILWTITTMNCAIFVILQCEKRKKLAILIILITKFVTGWFCFNCFSLFIVNWCILYTVYYSSACTIFINPNHCIPFEKLNCKPQGTRSSGFKGTLISCELIFVGDWMWTHFLYYYGNVIF